MRQALEGRLGKLRHSHSQVDRSRHELARVLSRQGKREEATELFEEVWHPGYRARETFKTNAGQGGLMKVRVPTEEESARAVAEPTKRPKEPPFTLRELGVLFSKNGKGD